MGVLFNPSNSTRYVIIRRPDINRIFSCFGSCSSTIVSSTVHGLCERFSEIVKHLSLGEYRGLSYLLILTKSALDWAPIPRITAIRVVEDPRVYDTVLQ